MEPGDYELAKDKGIVRMVRGIAEVLRGAADALDALVGEEVERIAVEERSREDRPEPTGAPQRPRGRQVRRPSR